MKRIAVLISGNGSNLQALIDAAASGQLAAEIVVVVANTPDAFGLTRAEKAGIPTEVLELRSVLADGGDRTGFDIELAVLVAGYSPDLVVLAGWMLIVGTDFLDHFPGQVINIHPALPGTFPGTDAIRRAHVAFGEGTINESGVMVHYVIPEVDAGPVIVSESVALRHEDTLDELETRIHAVEHRLLVDAVGRVLREMG